jgi:MATE family multidrug resistance protein
MVTNLAAHWLVGLPIGYWLCFSAGLGARGLWWGLSIGLIVAGVVLTTVWARSGRALRAR